MPDGKKGEFNWQMFIAQRARENNQEIFNPYIRDRTGKDAFETLSKLQSHGTQKELIGKGAYTTYVREQVTTYSQVLLQNDINSFKNGKKFLTTTEIEKVAEDAIPQHDENLNDESSKELNAHKVLGTRFFTDTIRETNSAKKHANPDHDNNSPSKKQRGR